MEAAIADRTAGSPVDEQIRWTNRSPAAIAAEVVEQGFAVCADTVQRILTNHLGLSRRQAVKDEAASAFPQRDEQFEHIAGRRRFYEFISQHREDYEKLGFDWVIGRPLDEFEVFTPEGVRQPPGEKN